MNEVKMTSLNLYCILVKYNANFEREHKFVSFKSKSIMWDIYKLHNMHIHFLKILTFRK